MLANERHEAIINRLEKDGQVVVKALSQDFNVTEDCIRKDLRLLESQGLLKRVHGGAMPLRSNPHRLKVSDRAHLHEEEKNQIIDKAMTLLKPGMTIFLDISTINVGIAKAIADAHMHVTVVTNMIDVLLVLIQEDYIDVIFAGGTLKHHYHGFIGSMTMNMLSYYTYDLAFIGTTGINQHTGQVTTYDTDDGLTKAFVMKASRYSYLVAESQKLKEEGSFNYASLQSFDGVIMDENISRRDRDAILRHDCHVI